MQINSTYFTQYRKKLGFSNQTSLKDFFKAKDIVSSINYEYLESLNNRLFEVIEKINRVVPAEISIKKIDEFGCNNITNIYEKLKINGIIPKLNNQGRRPEEVYFSWMRGLVISNYFTKAISHIFDTDTSNIQTIGDDDLVNIDSFKRTPKADLEVTFGNNQKIRVEMQSGFQGINDIKQHKVLEAKKIKRELGVSSVVVHIDLFNGQVAFVKIDDIDDESTNWITRQQMEGQTVFNIEQNLFIWKLTDMPPKIYNISFE